MMAGGHSARVVVIDASVALKWQLDDEQDSAQALSLRDDVLIHERVAAFAPGLYWYELINGVTSAVKRHRLARSQGDVALRHLFSMEVMLRTPPVDRTLSIALEYDISAYDSSYVSLGEMMGADLWTADRRLYDTLWGPLPWVKWIGDYPG